MNALGGPDSPFIVLIPVLDDWPSVAAVLAGLDDVFAKRRWRGSALIVDDGSVEKPTPLEFQPRGLRGVEVLRLTRNLGHQRAICVGLCHVEKNHPGCAVIVMDGDGQDSPADVPVLVSDFDRAAKRQVVFAGRSKRPEGVTFKAFYWLYRLLHRLLTGRAIRVGNFSVLPADAVGAVTSSPEAWSHYAAAVHQCRLPISVVNIPRAQRLHGPPRMNFVALVTHGLSAITVFGDIVSVRLLIAAGLAGVGGALLVLAMWLLPAATGAPLPSGAVWMTILAVAFLMQLNVGALVVGFLIHHGRRTASVIPKRDFESFVADFGSWDDLRASRRQRTGRGT
ncbi:MAG TPA: glycosyltransferase [Longimicrobiales bacterium]|nr:glycosyltransferase [Longimicrobiales bacterium]